MVRRLAADVNLREDADRGAPSSGCRRPSTDRSRPAGHKTTARRGTKATTSKKSVEIMQLVDTNSELELKVLLVGAAKSVSVTAVLLFLRNLCSMETAVLAHLDLLPSCSCSDTSRPMSFVIQHTRVMSGQCREGVLLSSGRQPPYRETSR